MTTSEFVLLKAIIDHDTSALESFYNKYGGMLYGFLFTALDNTTQAEAILKQVFTELPETLKDYNPQLLGLYTFLEQRAREKIRSLIITQQRSGNLQPSHRGSPLSQLSSEDYELFTLCYYRGFTFTDVAQQKGWTPDEARIRCRQALVRFNRTKVDIDD
ncbi:MAG: hypothetical protein QM731_07355 [Chitinophagaceae bacterium]